MVLSASPPDDQPGTDAWLDEVATALQLADSGLLVLVESRQPALLGLLAARLWFLDRNLIVTGTLRDLVAAPPGSIAVLCPDVAAAHTLNLQRPIFAQNALRTVVFCDPEQAAVLAREAPDFFSWVSHRVVCPDAPPAYAVCGLRAAFRRRARMIAWRHGNLDSAFCAAFPGRQLKHVDAGSASYASLVADAAPRPRVWIAWHGVQGPIQYRRLCWAHGEAGRRGRSILCDDAASLAPLDEALVVVHGQPAAPLTFRQAYDLLRAYPRPGLLAALLRMEPAAIDYAHWIIACGGEVPAIEELVASPDPGVTLAQAARSQGMPMRLSLLSEPLDWRSLALTRRWTPTPFDRIEKYNRWQFLARDAWQTGDPAVALLWAQRWLQVASSDDACVLLARIHLERGSFEEALEQLAGLTDPQALILRARGLVGLARYDSAASILDELPSNDDDSLISTALAVRASLQCLTGSLEDAAATAGLAVQRAQRSGDVMAQLVAYEQAAVVAVRAGSWGAWVVMDEGMTIMESLPELHVMRVWGTILRQWSRVRHAERPEHEVSPELLDAFVKLLGPDAPRRWWVSRIAGDSHAAAGRLRSALLAYQEALQLIDTKAAEQNLLGVDVLVSLAEVLGRLGRRNEARRYFRDAVSRLHSRGLSSDWLGSHLDQGVASTLAAFNDSGDERAQLVADDAGGQPHALSERFWHVRGGVPRLDDEGYLASADAQGWLGTPLVSFEELAATPCLVLLGESGIGKSYVLETARRAAQASQEDHEAIVSLRLSDTVDIRSKLNADAEFVAWRDGARDLTLFVDSLGAGSRAEALQQLIDVLTEGPIARLMLRVACRTDNFSQSFEQALSTLWDSQKRYTDTDYAAVGVYELAPLRRVDVARIAGDDAEMVLMQVEERRLQSLARHPGTLDLLLSRFREGGTLPVSRWELYRGICERLCAEPADGHPDQSAHDTLTSGQLLAVAARVAALMVLCAKRSIFVGADARELPDNALPLFALLGGAEPASEGAVEVSRREIEKVLTSRLFTAAAGVAVFARADYADYLAAYYLHARGVTTGELTGALLSHDATQCTVSPTRATAVWLAEVDDGLFEHLLQADPGALRLSNMATRPVVDRQRLTASLLDKMEKRELLDTMVGRGHGYGYAGLEHPDLPQQLKPWIVDHGAFLVARRAAIDIAEACNVRSLGDTLADVALDATDQAHIREQAVHAVTILGSSDNKLRLRPLAHGQCGDDPSDELRGGALRALWPEHMAGGEVLECLSPVKRRNYFGSYRAFILGLVAKADDLPYPAALLWVQRQLPLLDDLDPFVELAGAVIDCSWRRLSDPAIWRTLVDIVEFKLVSHQPLFDPVKHSNPLGTNVNLRRQLLNALISRATPSSRLSYWRLEAAGLVHPSDLSWLAEHLSGDGVEQPARRRFSTLLNELMLHNGPPDSAMLAEQLLQLAARDEEVRAALAGWLTPVNLDSELARSRRLPSADTEVAPRQAAETDDDLTMDQLRRDIIAQIDSAEAGEVEGFWLLLNLLSLRPPSRQYRQEFEVDIEKLNGWEHLDEALRARLVTLAKRYLEDYQPDQQACLEAGSLSFPEQAGYRALRLLYRRDQIWVERCPVELWQRWAPAVVRFARGDGEGGHTAQQLVERAYRHAQHTTLWSWAILLDQDGQKDRAIFDLDVFAEAWDARLGELLLLKLADERFGARSFGSLLDALLAHQVVGARAYARTWLALPLVANPSARLRVRAALQALLVRPHDDDWAAIMTVLEGDDAFAREVVLGAARAVDLTSLRRRGRSPWADVTASNLADFHIWLGRAFPADKYADRDAKRVLRGVTGPMQIEAWRSSLLVDLRERGTAEAVAAVADIERAFPQEAAYTFSRIGATEAWRERQWKPLTPSELLALGQRQQGTRV